MGFNKEFEEYHRSLYWDYDRFASALRRPARKSIRVNTLKTDKERIERFLKENNVSYSQIPWCLDGLFIDSPFELDTVEHQLGYYYVQGPSSMIPPVILDPKPGESVLDLCAAPGSKTTHMAQLMKNTGFLVANEASFVRVRALVINVQRCRVSNCVITRRDGVGFERYGERFDRVLLDAPCSDVGTAGKNPQVIARWSLERVQKLSNLQKKLITSAYNCLKIGGTLVYSTCTTSTEENEDVIEYLLEKYPGAEVDRIRLDGLRTRKGLSGNTVKAVRIMPQDNDAESYFIAKVRKNA